MRKTLKNFLEKGLFITIGGVTVEFPINPRWPGPNTLFRDITKLIDSLIGFGSVVAVLMIIVSGYTLITSTGDPDKVDQGQKTLTGAIIGLIIVWAVGLLMKTLLKGIGTI